jgi:diguanylate cyclase (GGDEF)-like protein
MRTNDTIDTSRLSGATLAAAPDAVLTCDAGGRVVAVNPAAERLFGAGALDRAVSELLGDVAPNGLAAIAGRRTAATATKADGAKAACEVAVAKLDGEPYFGVWVHEAAADAPAAPTAKSTHAVTHDELTGLPNRRLVNARLSGASAAARRSGATVCALLVDIDGFRLVNDSLGHDAGDLLLRAVAQRLDVCAAEGETLARVGGDEFLLVIPAVENGTEGAQERAARLQAELAEPFTVSGVEVHVAVTIGIAVAAPTDMGAGLLLKRADIAINRAKQDGDAIAVFAEDDAERRRTLTLTTRLRRAIERDELELHYQPLRRAGDESISSLEALLRWRPDGGDLMPPGAFIPLAESSGLIEPIGEWVIHEGCRQMREWLDAGIEARVGVNVSPRQLRRTDVPRVAAAALLEHRIAPESLTIELTESAIQKGARRIEDELARLRELGVFLAIDDFGSDYSSLARLRDLPFDMLKVDRAFVRDVPGDVRSTRLLQAIIGLADALDVLTCVEGVEDETQLKAACGAGADVIQGFYYSRPLPADRVVAQLIEDRDRAITDIRSRKSGAHIRSATPAA